MRNEDLTRRKWLGRVVVTLLETVAFVLLDEGDGIDSCKFRHDDWIFCLCINSLVHEDGIRIETVVHK